jgi:hypothetical protein
MVDDLHLHLQDHLDRFYAHGQASGCVAAEPVALCDWQNRARRLLWELLGLTRRPLGGGAPGRLAVRDDEGYREERWAVHRASAVLEATERCRHHVHDDDHRYDIQVALAWLARWGG